MRHRLNWLQPWHRARAQAMPARSRAVLPVVRVAGVLESAWAVAVEVVEVVV